MVKKKSKICFDIDGIICFTKNSDYKKSRPIKKNIDQINILHKQGYEINIYTARFMGRTNNNVKLAKKKGYKFTLSQLKKWGLQFNKLYFGKPSSDFYLDDKDINFKINWFSKLKKKLTNK